MCKFTGRAYFGHGTCVTQTGQLIDSTVSQFKIKMKNEISSNNNISTRYDAFYTLICLSISKKKQHWKASELEQHIAAL